MNLNSAGKKAKIGAASRTNQQGAALAVSLILLLVMTIVGVAAMDGARMEISMAGLVQQQQIALRRSERVLALAEEQVESIVEAAGLYEFENGDNAEDGYYGPTDNIDATALDWSDLKTIKDIDALKRTDNGLDDDDAVVIQYLGAQKIPGNNQGEDGSAGIAGDEAHVYRITTRSATGAKSVRIIESIYTSFEAP